jgi:nucleoside triphosphate diphosphatase
MQPSRDIARLIEIVEALRQPETGCPWDKEQTVETIVPYTIEEAYEAADAIARGDMADLKDELGDLLLQVVFHSRIAEEQAYFDFGSVVEAITQKMIRRHPHVFAKSQDLTPEERKALWSAIKAEEKKAKDEARRGHPGANFLPGGRTEGGLLDDIPVTLPGLTRAVKLQAKAATVGFDWNDARLVLEKIREETGEIAAALEAGDQQALEVEIGDLFFALANLARHLQTDPEAAIRRANLKLERRFRFIENELERQGKTAAAAGLEEMEALWTLAKQREAPSQDEEQQKIKAR